MSIVTEPRPAHNTWELREDADMIRKIAGTVARAVEGVAFMGDGLLYQFDCPGGCNDDPGRGVTVRMWQGDLWVYIHLAAMPGTDYTGLVQTVQKRVAATLENLLGLVPTAVEVELQSLEVPETAARADSPLADASPVLPVHHPVPQVNARYA